MTQPAPRAHFGGPDLPAGRLRDLLEERVAAVPRGGEIDFASYYFRDRRLARALVAARRRGVAVRLTLDGHPRTPRANRLAVALLEGPDGLGAGLRLVRGRCDGSGVGKLLRPRLHEKLYCFSHPRPCAFVGSFNPSGDEPEEEPAVREAIRDQDRGHNLLVELTDPTLVGALVAHARHLHASIHGPWERLRWAANRAVVAPDGTRLHFWPRATPNPVLRLLRGCGEGARVRLASSHISGPSALRALRALLRRGARLEILTDETHRRVPPRMERELRAAGAALRRVVHPDGYPMHNKFALIDAPGSQRLVFGSFNWTEPSLRLNRELGVVTEAPGLREAFAERWAALDALARGA